MINSKSTALIAILMILSNLTIAIHGKKDNSDELIKIPVKELAKKNWQQVTKNIKSTEDSLFKCIIEYKSVFVKYNGLESVNKELSDVLIESIWDYAIGKKAYDPGFLTGQFQTILKADLPDDDPVYTIYNITKYRGKKEYVCILDLVGINNTKLGYARVTALDISLSNEEDLTGNVRKLFIDYLTQQAVKYEKDGIYKAAIEKLAIYKGIYFDESSLSEIFAKATKENKLVFIDTYTSWCAPCKMMNKNVFILKEVGDFFNKHFINTKVDIEKGEGIKLGEKFDIRAVPTFLFLNGEGELVFKTTGYQEADVFMKNVQEGVLSRQQNGI